MSNTLQILPMELMEEGDNSSAFRTLKNASQQFTSFSTLKKHRFSLLLIIFFLFLVLRFNDILQKHLHDTYRKPKVIIEPKNGYS